MGNEYSKALQEFKEMIEEIRKQISSLKCTASEQSKSIEIVQNSLKEQQKLIEYQEKLSQSVNLLEIRMRDQENVITEQLSKQSFMATPKQTISQDDILHTLQNTSTSNIQETEVQQYPSESNSSPEQLFALEELSTSSSDNENEKKEGHSDSSMKLMLNEDYFQNQ
jgi:paraquat-inducible protein B